MGYEAKKERKWRRGDVFIGEFPRDIGSHLERGARPYLIIQNDIGNRRAPTTIVVPMTTKLKRLEMPCHVYTDYGDLRPSMIMCEQIRIVDFERGWKYITTLPPRVMRQVDYALKNILGIEY